jgi:threonine/homoserine/homoserine lactone efflux protein
MIVSFLLATVISFAGSIQAGPVNLNVAFLSLKGEKRGALLMALGGSLPEMLYSAIAIFFSSIFLQNVRFVKGFELISIPVLLVLGILQLIKKPAKKASEPVKGRKQFLKGLVLGMANPMLIIFWVTVLVFVQEMNLVHLNGWSDKFGFSLGTSAGAFLLMLLIAALLNGNRIRVPEKLMYYSDKILGSILLLLALYQTGRFLL